MPTARVPSPHVGLFRHFGVMAVCWLVGCTIPDENHCAHRSDAEARTNHAWCASNRSLPYCDLCVPSTVDNGCSATPPGSGCMSGEPAASSSTDAGPSSSGDTESPQCEGEGWVQACADLDPLAPFCSAGACTSCDDTLCSDEVCEPRPGAACVPCRPDAAEHCPGGAPLCSDGLECSAVCTRHEHCPGSACDLRLGICIPPDGAIAYVDADAGNCRSTLGGNWATPITYCDLSTAAASVPTPDPVVIFVRAASSEYSTAVDIPQGATVAIVRDPQVADQEPVLRLAASAAYVINLPDTAKLYLEGIRVSGVGSTTTIGVQCDGVPGDKTQVWLDDVDIRANADAVRASDCAVHVRRTAIHDNRGVGLFVTGGELSVESSVIAENNGEGILVSGGSLTMRYSDLLGNNTDGTGINLSCEGRVEGSIDASISLHDDITSGSSIACEIATMRTIDETSFGSDRPPLSELFADVERGRLRSSGDALPSDARVVWTPGDPYFDIDGNPRPGLDRETVFVGASEPSP